MIFPLKLSSHVKTTYAVSPFCPGIEDAKAEKWSIYSCSFCRYYLQYIIYLFLLTPLSKFEKNQPEIILFLAMAVLFLMKLSACRGHNNQHVTHVFECYTFVAHATIGRVLVIVKPPEA